MHFILHLLPNFIQTKKIVIKFYEQYNINQHLDSLKYIKLIYVVYN